MTTILESLKYADAIIHGGNPHDDDIAQDWADNEFATGEECEPWWIAGCFDAGAAAELRDSGIDPAVVSTMHNVRGSNASIGYWHSNCDLSIDDVRQLIAE